MHKKIQDDRPAYLSSDEAKFSLGVHRGPLVSDHYETSEVEHVESLGGISLATTKKTRKQRLARHWKRFWCCYLVGNITFLAIFLPIFFLVIIPAISQLVVNKSDLILFHGAVMQPRPDSIQLTLQSTLDLKIALAVRIDPIMLTLFNRDTGADNPWANISIEGQTMKGDAALGVNDQHTPITNVSVWTNYVHDVVFQRRSTVSLRGSTNAYLGKLKSRVTMDKDVVSPGLDSLAGFRISNSTILLPAYEDGTNLIGIATLPNPSVLTIEIGKIILDIYSGNLLIGNATLDEVILKPGNNTNPITGVLDLKKIISNLGDVIESQASALPAGNLALTAITRSVLWNDTEVPYYTKVLQELNLTANVGLVSTLRNTLHNLLHPNGSSNTRSFSSTISGFNLTSAVDNAKANLNMADSTDVSSALKRSAHLMDTLVEEQPVKRDAIIESLARFYSNELTL